MGKKVRKCVECEQFCNYGLKIHITKLYIAKQVKNQ